MTISEIIENFDDARTNSVSIITKKRWISQLDLKIWGEILKPRGDNAFYGYGKEISLDTTVKAPDEYAEIYNLYMNMKLDIMNGEIGRSNNSAMLFNRMYKEMHDYINRNQAVNSNTSLRVGDYNV